MFFGDGVSNQNVDGEDSNFLNLTEKLQYQDSVVLA